MKTVNLHAAKTHLSRLVDEAVSGKEVVIAKAGTPVAKLVPVLAAQQTLESCEEDREVKRLRQVIVGSGLEPF